MNKLTFRKSVIVDISTKYITAQDAQLMTVTGMECNDAPGHVASVDYGRGEIFCVADHEPEEMREFGFSDAFVNIFTALKEQDIPYVRFDGDGSDIDGDLPTFSW